MPASITIIDNEAGEQDIEAVFSYFQSIDTQFSTYKKTSEVEKINDGQVKPEDYSREMERILRLADKTTQETQGYFTVRFDGKLDPSGIVKGYAIHEGAKLLAKRGYRNFSVEIGGDIEVHGKNAEGRKWQIGIQNPFQTDEIVKILELSNKGIATSGTYLRGSHIYDPVHKRQATEIASITVVGPNIMDADRLATAAFAMGEQGIAFIDTLPGFAGYMIAKNKRAYMTRSLTKYLKT